MKLKFCPYTYYHDKHCILVHGRVCFIVLFFMELGPHPSWQASILPPGYTPNPRSSVLICSANSNVNKYGSKMKYRFLGLTPSICDDQSSSSIILTACAITKEKHLCVCPCGCFQGDRTEVAEETLNLGSPIPWDGVLD